MSARQTARQTLWALCAAGVLLGVLGNGVAWAQEPQVVVRDIMPGVRRNMWWHPHGAKVYDGIKAVLEVLYGGGVGRRLSAMVRMVKLFLRSFRG